jgi:hypothetical protein
LQGKAEIEAAELLRDITRLRRATRRSLGTPWLPLVYFGALTMLSAALVDRGAPWALLALWVLAGAAGMLLIRRHYARRADRRGLTGRARSWRVAWLLCVGTFAAGMCGGVLWGVEGGVAGPMAVVLIGYVVLGVQQRRATVAVAAVPAAAAAALAWAAGRSAPFAELAFGAALTLAGALLFVLGRER